MISVIVIARNEEDRLKTCLESVKWADEIILVDNGSTDNTAEVGKSFDVKIVDTKLEDFSEVRNLGFEKAKGDWVLYVDADERVLAPLKEEILKVTESDEFSAYALSRRNVIFGQEVNYGPYKKDWVIRLFKKSDFEGWIGKVHEYGMFKGKLGYSKSSLLHLTHRDVDHIVLKSLDWSKIDAKLRLDANHPKMSGWRFFRIFITEILNQGIKRKGFFGGTVGIMDSLLQSFSMLITYVRLWEYQQPKPLNEKYAEIDKNLIENDFNY